MKQEGVITRRKNVQVNKVNDNEIIPGLDMLDYLPCIGVNIVEPYYDIESVNFVPAKVGIIKVIRNETVEFYHVYRDENKYFHYDKLDFKDWLASSYSIRKKELLVTKNTNELITYNEV